MFIFAIPIGLQVSSNVIRPKAEFEVQQNLAESIVNCSRREAIIVNVGFFSKFLLDPFDFSGDFAFCKTH